MGLRSIKPNPKVQQGKFNKKFDNNNLQCFKTAMMVAVKAVVYTHLHFLWHGDTATVRYYVICKFLAYSM